MACSSRSPGVRKGSRRKRASSAFSLRIMRRPGFILLAFLLAGAPAQGEERSTRVSVGTLQMTGWGAAQPPIPRARPLINAARRGAAAKQIPISVGTLQMTGRGQASHP